MQAGALPASLAAETAMTDLPRPLADRTATCRMNPWERALVRLGFAASGALIGFGLSLGNPFLALACGLVTGVFGHWLVERENGAPST